MCTFLLNFLDWGFSTEFPSLYIPSLLSLPPERHRRKHCLINMFMRCFPSGSKFPVNFNWEWRFSTEFLSMYCHSLLSLRSQKQRRQYLINMFRNFLLILIRNGGLHTPSKQNVDLRTMTLRWQF